MAKKSEIDSLKTKQQRFSEAKRDRMFVSKRHVTSDAYRALTTSTACHVFRIFLTKCRWEKLQTKPGRREKEWVHANNGELQFTYKEAWEDWGISNNRFTRAIDQLVEVGLIDIAHSGFGLHKDVTLYVISDRWEKYGTDEFVHAKRPKRLGLGFRQGNRHGKNSKKK